MIFLKALTIFIISISISKIIISISETNENKNDSTDVYVRFWGYLNCTHIGGHDVLINLKKDGKTINVFNGNCKSIFNNYTTTNDLSSKFSADFAYFDGSKTTWKNNTDAECTKCPLKEYHFEFWDCRFKVINFNESKKGKS